MKNKFKILTLLCSAFLFIGCSYSSSSIDTSSSNSTNSSSNSSIEVEYTREEYSNPIKIHRQDGSTYFVACADPDIIYGDDGYYYLYITNAECEMGDKGITFDRGPIFRSDDMINWTWCGSVFDGFPHATDWGNPEAGVWAPSIVKVGDRYNYYYSLSSWGDPNPGIGVATSPTPYGPWTHYGKLLDQEMTGVINGIDPFVTYENDELYIVWGSFYGIAAAKLTDDGTELFYGDLVKDHLTWIIDNNQSDGMNVEINYEGSYIIKKDDYYYYFGSQGTCLSGTNSTYTVRVGKSKSLFGPYLGNDGKDMINGNCGEVVVKPSDKVAGTGHNSVIQDEAGDYYLVYHGYDIYGEHSDERQLFIDKLLWDENGYPYVDNKEASINEVKQGPLVIKKEEQ